MNIVPTLGPVMSFTEDSTSLDGKEDLLLALNSDGTVKLNAGAIPIGVMQSKLQEGEAAVSVRLLGAGGTFRCIQNAAIAVGARVMVDTSAKTKVITATTSGLPVRSLGIKVADSSNTASGAAGDVIEVMDLQELVTALDAAVAVSLTQVALTDSSGGTADNTIAAITEAGTAGSADTTPVKNAIADLTAAVNKARVDIAAIKAVLDTAGITS